MATPISGATPSTAQNRPCWECSRPVAPYQAARTATAWQAVICPSCEAWVAARLGQITAGDAQRRDTW